MNDRPALPWLAGPGVMPERLRAHDWAATPLGRMADWPQSLRTAVDLCLGCGFASFVWWGPQLVQVYNDAALAIIQGKHPEAFGVPASQGWADVWEYIGPVAEGVVASGQTVQGENMPLLTERGGRPEQAWFTFSYGPLHDEAGDVAGVFVVAIETTARMMAERRRAAAQSQLLEREARQAFLLRLSDMLRPLADPAAVQAVATRALGEQLGADRVMYGEVDGQDQERFTVRHEFVRQDMPSAAGRYRFSDFGSHVSASLRAGQTMAVADLSAVPALDAAALAAYRAGRVVAYLAVPLVKAGRIVAYLAVHQRQARAWTPHEVALVEEAAERTWAAVERACAEQALRESQARFAQFGEASSDVLWIRDVGTDRLEYASPAFERLYGVPRETIADDPGLARWAALIDPRDREAVLDTLVRVRAGVRATQEFRVHRPAGGMRWVRDTEFPLHDAAGRVQRIGGIGQDVTALKRAEEALREADRRKDEFLAMLAHELRNPLAPLTNAHHLLDRTEPLTARGRQALGLAQRQTQQLQRLVDDLLEISRITRGKIEIRPEPMSVSAAVFNAVESVSAQTDQRRQRVEIVVPATPARIVADPARIAQVLENLLTNASKYTPEGGAIRVEVQERASPDQGGAAEVVVHVADDGVGIDPDKIPALFEIFHQIDATLDRAQGGLGIGLALVRRLVELHGGCVSAASEGLGKGATFTVVLPSDV